MKKILLIILLSLIVLSCGDENNEEDVKKCTKNSDCDTNYCKDSKCETLPCTETCDSNAKCTQLDETPEKWECKCNDGFIGDGLSCEVDPCKDLTCHRYASCKIIKGTPTCKCRKGLAGNGVTTCTDVDECLFGSKPCDKYHHCINNFGAPATCTDRNECEEYNNGLCGDPEKFRCINNDGAPVTCEEI